MNSRMNKYYEKEEIGNTRYHKNEELYKEISKSELNNYEVKSNTTVLGDSEASIDVEKIKKILDTKYNDIPKRKSIRIDEEEVKEEKLEDTKEYDINVILEKAKEQKPDNYEEERLKKLHDTGFDILKKLNIDKKEPLKDSQEEDFEEDNLKNLINTIAINEKESKNAALDILTDLKGSDDTEVLEGLKETIATKEEEDDFSKELDITKDDITDINESTKMVNSFYTSSNAINKKDFEDIDDFSKSIESNNTFLKVVISLIVIIFIIGIILLIKTIYFS